MHCTTRSRAAPAPSNPLMSAAQAGDGKELSLDGQALNASISQPWGVALSDDGATLFFAEFGGQRYRNDTRCKTAGFGCTLENKLNPACNDQAPGRSGFTGLNSCDCGCDIFFMHAAGHRVRKLHPLTGPASQVTTVCGSGVRGFREGKASEANFNHPNDVLPFGQAGNLLIADSLNHRVRLYNFATDLVSTVVGGPRRGFRDSSNSSQAELNYPAGLACHGSVVYIADRGNNCIRRWDGEREGVVATVAGNCELGSDLDLN